MKLSHTRKVINKFNMLGDKVSIPEQIFITYITHNSEKIVVKRGNQNV